MGWRPGSPPTVTVYWDETLVATWGAQRNILHITGTERAQPLIKWSVAAVVGGRDVWGNLKKKKRREKQVSIFITYDLPLLQIPNYSSIKK